MPALSFDELQDMDRQAHRACPVQLRVWAGNIKAARTAMNDDDRDYADALLLKIEHGIRSQQVSMPDTAEPLCMQLKLDFIALQA